MYSPELGRVGRDDENWVGSGRVGSELGRRAKLMYLVLRHNPIGSAVRRFQFQFHSLLNVKCQCFDAVGWAAGRASGL